MRKPSDRYVRKSMKKLKRLESRGARPRRLKRLAKKITLMIDKYQAKKIVWDKWKKEAPIDEVLEATVGVSP